MTRKQRHQYKVLGLSLLLGLSIFSFIYINNVELGMDQHVPENIFVEELEPNEEEILPDVELIKLLMHKAIEFVTFNAPSISI